MENKPLFYVNNPLLLQAILGTSHCINCKLQKTNGYLYYENERHPVGRAFLEFCYSEIFNIRRFPGYENYYSRCSNNCFWMVEEGIITEKDIDEACMQLKDLYTFTQDHLKSLGKEEMRVYRSLRPVEIDSFRIDDNSNIYMQSNIMTSYAYRPYTTYSTNVKITRVIPRQDVLMIDDMTGYPNSNELCGYKAETGEYELWILNRDRYGRISIKPEDIIEDPQGLIKTEHIRHMNTGVLQNSSSNQEDAALYESVTAPAKLVNGTHLQNGLLTGTKQKLRSYINK